MIPLKSPDPPQNPSHSFFSLAPNRRKKTNPFSTFFNKTPNPFNFSPDLKKFIISYYLLLFEPFAQICVLVSLINQIVVMK